MLPMMGHKTVLNYGIANEHPDYYIGMGLTAEEVSKKYNVTRDEQDAFSFASHMKALEAQKAGKFTSQIVPVEVTENYFDAKSGTKQSRSWTVSQDEGPRADTTIEALGKLKPAFAMGGTVTAGNASQTSDGAAFVLVVSEKLVKELHLEPIARMVSYATAGVEPSLMGIGPVEAIPIALKKAGLTLKDIQQIELNEAFAAQSLAVMKTLDIDPSIVNVNGGAIALGHPLGCSGAKLSIQLFNEMRLRNQKYGMVTACVGGGQGVAGIYELL
jgi:acetyl-CoA acyltransferase